MDIPPFCGLDDLTTESDVEQKHLQPIITSKYPIGLGYGPGDYITKSNARHLLLDKGGRKQVFYPDYILCLLGLPCVVIEAKDRGEDADNAYNEARKYANELNARLPTGINPCMKIIASNGDELLYGYSDSDRPIERIPFDSIQIGSQQYDSLLEFAKRDVVLKEAKKLDRLAAPKGFTRPLERNRSRPEPANFPKLVFTKSAGFATPFA